MTYPNYYRALLTLFIYILIQRICNTQWRIVKFKVLVDDVDVVKLRAQANASMPASYNSNIQLLILILISNNNSDFRFHEFLL